ncbi:1815_t:CDS:2, partial [Cetraspora pellucida]
MNNQYCSAHKATPYNLVFSQLPHNDHNTAVILQENDNDDYGNGESDPEINNNSDLEGSYSDSNSNSLKYFTCNSNTSDSESDPEINNSSDLEGSNLYSSNSNSLEYFTCNSNTSDSGFNRNSLNSESSGFVTENNSKMIEIIEISDTESNDRYTYQEKEKWQEKRCYTYQEKENWQEEIVESQKIIRNNNPNQDSYQIACKFGIIDRWYPANELEPLGTSDYPDLDI